MSKYAFLVAGEESAYFEVNNRLRLKQFGSWLVAEKIAQEKLARQQTSSTLAAIHLAKRIAADKGIEVEEAFGLLQQQDDASAALLLIDYMEEAERLMEKSLSPQEVDRAMISTFVRVRGEGLIGGEWQPLSDWSDEDTASLSEPLMDRIKDFILAEQGITTEDVDAEAVEVEEPAGKGKAK